MLKIYGILLGLLLSSCLQAKSEDQIDLIIFSHPSEEQNNLHNFSSDLIPFTQGIDLKAQSSNSYHLLPKSQSSLNNELYLLNHKSNYSVLGHYSWKQPHNNREAIILPKSTNKGWQVEGLIKIRKDTYYALATHLKLSPPNKPNSYFEVKQSQRIKENEVYYLDHPQIGLLIKIH